MSAYQEVETLIRTLPMHLITSIFLSGILLIGLGGKFQNFETGAASSDGNTLDNSELLTERGSGRDEQKQTPTLEQEVDA
ncbi:MAG: hypothetical protein SXA11_09215 [Cyanobacteriota bacterium]|nr:hypothetical protein [Cyanobacteriota bacterium]